MTVRQEGGKGAIVSQKSKLEVARPPNLAEKDYR